MIKMLSQNNRSTYNLITYMADTNEDFQQIDKTKLPMGTECYVIEDQKWYILNSNKEWKDNGGNKNSEESSIQIEELNITENGIYTAPEDTAYSPINVNIPIPPEIDIESLAINENGTYTAQSGKAYSPVTVAIPIPPEVDIEPLSVTENGTYTAQSGKAYSPVTVNIPSGGGELTLLASGTYTKANEATDNTKLEIPVTVSGTVQGILVYAETPVSGVSQTYGWWRNWLVPQSAKDLFGNNPQITMLYKTATGNPVGQPQNVSKVEIDAGQATVTVYARDTNYVVRNNTYIWELWGVA